MLEIKPAEGGRDSEVIACLNPTPDLFLDLARDGLLLYSAGDPKICL